MIGSSLGLGIGLQGQPKQYAEMAYKKLASDAAVKKQQADVDKEFLKLYKDAVFVKPGYVLPGQLEEYQEKMATTMARMNQKHIERDYTGAVQELNNFKMEAQPYLTNFTKMQALGKVLGQSAIDENTYNMIMTGGKDQFNQATSNKFSGIFYDPNTKTLSPNVYPRVDLQKKIKSNLLDEQFITVGKGKDAAGKPTDIKKLTDPTKAAIITANISDPALIQTYSVELGNMPENRDLDAETFDMKVKQRIQDETRRIIDVLEREKSTGAGINIVNNMGGDKTVAPFIAGGKGTINFYEQSSGNNLKVKTRASFNFGNIESVEASGANFYNQSGQRLKSPDVTNYTFGQTQFVPVLKEKLTDEQLKKLYRILEGDGRKDLIEQGTTLINQFNSNSSDAVIPDGLDEYIASYFPNNVDIKTITSGQDKQGNGVYKMSEVTKHEQVIKSSKEDEATKNQLIKEMNAERDKFKGELKTKSTNKPKTSVPKTESTKPKRLIWDNVQKKMVEAK